MKCRVHVLDFSCFSVRSERIWEGLGLPVAFSEFVCQAQEGSLKSSGATGNLEA